MAGRSTGKAKAAPGPRQRLLDAAYELFSTQGIGQVGVDAILEKADCAKASLYSHFNSKTGLALEFLKLREERWTLKWLKAEIERREARPKDRLLAVFDVFGEWFETAGFEGCSFINVMLETTQDPDIRTASIRHLANIRAIIRGLAEEAGFGDAAVFADIWHMLMKGSIIAAGEGNKQAAAEAKRAGRLIMAGWPKA